MDGLRQKRVSGTSWCFAEGGEGLFSQHFTCIEHYKVVLKEAAPPGCRSAGKSAGRNKGRSAAWRPVVYIARGPHLWPQRIPPQQRNVCAVPFNLAPHVVQHLFCDAAPAAWHVESLAGVGSLQRQHNQPGWKS